MRCPRIATRGGGIVSKADRRRNPKNRKAQERFDLNGDSRFDLVFCNSHNHWEKPPAYVFPDPLGEAAPQTLPSDGAMTGTVADLNAGGLDDLVLGMWNNGPHGMTSIHPGNQRDGGPEEYYESSPFRLPKNAVPTRISWKADIPPKTWVKAQCRSADSKEQLAGAAWFGPGGPDTWFVRPQALDRETLAGRWLQYRLALGRPMVSRPHGLPK